MLMYIDQHYKQYPPWTLPTLPRNSSDMDDKKKSSSQQPHTSNGSDDGLFNIKAMTFLVLWYLFSFFTLFMNKHILSTLKGEPTILATSQMLATTMFGGLHLYLPCGLYTPVKREAKPASFLRNMMIVGTLRFSTVVLGLISLKYVAVSFTETVKSSAPLFTVVIAAILLRERTGLVVICSLLPIMLGLALCTAYELSFDIRGFVAAVATNLTECLQNVCAKMLISGENYKYNPAEMQFYTGLASMAIQIPAQYLLLDQEKLAASWGIQLACSLALCAFFYHTQTIVEYALLQYIRPVTHSVANTVKRALLIWISVLVFGNPVTLWSGVGMVIVTVGVFVYNKARERDQRMRESA